MATNNVNQRFRGPKRFVEKIWSRISLTATTSVTSKTLHTVGDRETLVRSIIQISVGSATGGSAGSYTIMLSVDPQGTATSVPATGENLENNGDKNVLWQYHSSFPAVEMHNSIDVDLKSMRKLMPGDEITLRVISSQTASILIGGFVTQFFKQA